MSGSYLALKRLVETNLREKEQASEMLKGYVTTITREVGLAVSMREIRREYNLFDRKKYVQSCP